MSKPSFKTISLIKVVMCLTVLSSLFFNVQATNNKTIEELFMNSLIADVIYVDLPKLNVADFKKTLENHAEWRIEPKRIERP